MNTVKIKIKNLVYLLAYALLLVKIALANTTFVEFVDVRGYLFKIVYLVAFLLIGYKLIYIDKYVINSVLIIVCFVSFGILGFASSNYTELLVMIMLIVGAKGIRLKNITQCYFYVYGTVMLIALIAASIGLIENYCVQSNAYRVRWALGNTYPTDFAAGIFFMLLAYSNMKQKWKIRYTLVWSIVIAVVYYYTDARTSCLLSVMYLILLMLFNKLFLNNERPFLCKTIHGISVIIFPLMAFLSYVAVFLYDKGNSIIKALNVILNYRIGFASKAINEYGIPLLGQKIKMLGAGWGTDVSQSYFYIDNGYYYMAIVFGIFISIIVISGFTLSAYKTKNTKIHIIIIMLAINGLIEPRFINYLYNPFLMLIGSAFFTKKGTELEL